MSDISGKILSGLLKRLIALTFLVGVIIGAVIITVLFWILGVIIDPYTYKPRFGKLKSIRD